jgi:hypothetical protein
METCLGSMSTFQMLLKKKKFKFMFKVFTFPVWDPGDQQAYLRSADISTQTS